MDSFFPPSYTLSLGTDKIELLAIMQAALKGDKKEKVRV